MFKKGFLLAKASASSASISRAEPAALPHAAKVEQGALPTELIIQIVESLVSHGGPRLQHDLSSLRRASKLLSNVATPHFYKTIELSRGDRAMALIKQLQARRKLCDTTRAIWWDEKKAMWPDYLSAPYIQLANVDEVAYWNTETSSDLPAPFHIGCHFALRDVGPWCKPTDVPDFDPPTKPINTMQCTPTINVEYGMLNNELGQNPRRALWAAHLVAPSLMGTDLYIEPQTITHLTLTIASHPKVFEEDIEVIWEVLVCSRVPLLEHFTLQCIDFAKKADKDMNPSERMWQELCGWERRVSKLESILRSCNDPRTRFVRLNTPDLTRKSTMLDDVRKFTLEQWRERVYHGRAGPWRDPLTQTVKPREAQGAGPGPLDDDEIHDDDDYEVEDDWGEDVDDEEDYGWDQYDDDHDEGGLEDLD